MPKLFKVCRRNLVPIFPNQKDNEREKFMEKWKQYILRNQLDFPNIKWYSVLYSRF